VGWQPGSANLTTGIRSCANTGVHLRGGMPLTSFLSSPASEQFTGTAEVKDARSQLTRATFNAETEMESACCPPLTTQAGWRDHWS